MKSNKRIKFIYAFILIDLLLIGLLFAYQIYSVNQLKAEVKELSYLDITKDRYNSANICFGGYRVVEDAIKKYLDDFAVNIQEASNIASDEEFNSILSYKNIESDGPNFEKSFTYLDEVSKKYNNKIEYLLGRLKEDTIKNYINSYTKSVYYRDLYIELMLEDNMLLEFYTTQELLLNTKNYVNEYITLSNKVLTFLKEHPDSWFLDNGEVKFKNHNDYLDLLNKIDENEKKYSSNNANS